MSQEPPARELIQHLSDLQAIMKRLVELATQKLAAMRKADTALLQSCAAQEDQLLRELFQQQQGRNAVLARLAQSLPAPVTPPTDQLGVPPQKLRLAEIAERLPEPLASTLRARTLALREIAEQLQRKNRLVASVAQNLQAHIRGIFAELAQIGQERTVYGPPGQHQAGAAAGSSPRQWWVDAVG